MGDRAKFLVTFSIVGFIAGVGANLAWHTVVPFVLKIFPEMLQLEWVLSGIAGSAITTIIIVLWAYISSSKK